MLKSRSKLHTHDDGKRDRERDGVRCSVLVGDDIPHVVVGGGGGGREGEGRGGGRGGGGRGGGGGGGWWGEERGRGLVVVVVVVVVLTRCSRDVFVHDEELFAIEG